VAGVPAPARAQSPVDSVATEARLRRLEQAVGDLRAENERLRAGRAAPSATDPAVVRAAGRAPSLALGGLVQVQGEFGDRTDARFTTDNDRFLLRRARLNASGRFLEHFEFRTELDLGGSLGEAGGLRAQATDFFVTWKRFAGAAVRAGQFKTPHGFEQLAPDPRLPTIERSLANDRLTLGRQVGVQVSGEGRERRVVYAAGLFNGTGVNTSANDDEAFAYVARAAGAPLVTTWRGRTLRGEVGASGFSSHDASAAAPPEIGFDAVPGGAADNLFSGLRRGFAFDAQVQFGRLELWGEYFRARFEPTDARPARRVDASGVYVQALVFVVRDRLQALAKVERFDPRHDAGADESRVYTVGLNHFFKGDDIKLMVNALILDAAPNTATEARVLARTQIAF
jgi:hypothetical protein